MRVKIVVSQVNMVAIHMVSIVVYEFNEFNMTKIENPNDFIINNVILYWILFFGTSPTTIRKDIFLFQGDSP